MADPYEELIDGETFIRGPLNRPHELLCDRIQSWVESRLPANSAFKLLPRRTTLTLRAGTKICPDLTLVRHEDSRLYLAVEVLQPGDHHPDTVLKKQLYADCRVPRLWIIDSRYQNIEIYGTTADTFRLENILACNDGLADVALSGSAYPLVEIFSRI